MMGELPLAWMMDKSNSTHLPSPTLITGAQMLLAKPMELTSSTVRTMSLSWAVTTKMAIHMLAQPESSIQEKLYGLRSMLELTNTLCLEERTLKFM